MIKVSDRLFVVKPGLVIYEEGGAVCFASSSVTLIDDGSLILVDTGLREDWPEIRSGIEEAGFSPSEIDIVVNTHLHPDHMGCNDRFGARKYAHPKEIQRAGVVGYTPCPREISGRTSMIETPGHVDGHISVVFEGRVVVAGDAVPTRKHYLGRIIPRIHTDAQKAMESLMKILEIAEIIIPGHDHPVEVPRRQKTPCSDHGVKLQGEH